MISSLNRFVTDENLSSVLKPHTKPNNNILNGEEFFIVTYNDGICLFE